MTLFLITGTAAAGYTTQAKRPLPPVRPLSQRRSLRPSPATSSASVVWDFVGDGTDDVEDHVVEEEEYPWSNGDDA